MVLSDAGLFREAAYIGGRWYEARETLPVDNPADGSVVGHVPVCTAADTDTAIAAARAAFPAWRDRPAGERAAVLEAWHDAMLAARDDLARLMTIEQGKPLTEAAGEIDYGASFVKWFAEEARRVAGETVPAPTADRRIVVLRQPVGVAAAITPWNFPNAMITRKVAPALAAGCTVVLKPSSATPFSALALAALAERAGVPAGVFNVVTGRSGEIGGALTASPDVAKLSFTGSTEVGRQLMADCAPTLKRLSLELGGNAPFLVFADADLDLAVAGAMASKFRNAGQTCVCANRILVHADVYDAFASKLAQAVRGLVVGDGLEAGVTIGPLIDDAAVEKVHAHLDDALARGASAVAGGTARPARGGRFVTPTVLTGVTPAMRCTQEETFGPVAPLVRFTDDDEAIALANDTPHGLAAYFYTEGVRRAWRVAERIEAGMVGLNTGSVSMAMAPFGGVKQSGFGREGSRHGLDEYLQLKTFHVASLD
jgi:succinate-semialdehyde dehydrogenase/glutarate-semialdehyde dehydrogenase